MDEKSGNDLFIRDLQEAKQEIRIDIPNPLCSDINIHNRIAEALKQAIARGVKVYVRAESKKDLPSGIKPFAVENRYVYNPITIIDRMIIWFGEPLSGANFISEGVRLTTRYRPIIRVKGRNTANSIFGFLGMAHTAD